MRNTFRFLLLFIICVSASFTSKAQVNVQDSLILVELYNSTNGPNWTLPHNQWFNGAPVKSWYGIQVDSERVTKLTLGKANLKGMIPSSIGNLTELTDLYLDDNQLTGDIPPILGNLGRLKILYLDKNKLTGSIPSSLGNLSQLTDLSFWNNQLTGEIPSELGNLSKLQQLDLSRNQLTGPIPESFGNLSKLMALTLNYNRLSGSIPRSIGNLPSLINLYLYSNKFSGPVPSSFFPLRIYITDLNDNLLTFDGMEAIGETNYFFGYSPQHSIPLYFNDSAVWVNAGGTLSNNTYQLYKNGALVSTQAGDSLLKINGYSDTDSFYISVSNSVATKLTLYTDTVQLKLSYYTVKDGNWSDPTIWSSGSVPPVTAYVLIRNNVTVNQDVTCYAVKVEPPTGSINVLSGVHFTVTH